MKNLFWIVVVVSVLDLIPYFAVPQEYRKTVGTEKILPGGGAWMYLKYMAEHKQP